MTKRIINRLGPDAKGQNTLFPDKLHPLGYDNRAMATMSDIKKSLEMAAREGTGVFCRIKGRRESLIIHNIDDLGRVVFSKFITSDGRRNKRISIVEGSRRVADVTAVLWIERRAVVVDHNF